MLGPHRNVGPNVLSQHHIEGTALYAVLSSYRVPTSYRRCTYMKDIWLYVLHISAPHGRRRRVVAGGPACVDPLLQPVWVICPACVGNVCVGHMLQSAWAICRTHVSLWACAGSAYLDAGCVGRGVCGLCVWGGCVCVCVCVLLSGVCRGGCGAGLCGPVFAGRSLCAWAATQPRAVRLTPTLPAQPCMPAYIYI
jgi:hypothetical protein